MEKKLEELRRLVARGESRTLEFKRSTAELRAALHTLCAMANGQGGRVLLGVSPSGAIVGQQVSEQTMHELAAALEGFEPPLPISIERVACAEGRQVLVLTITGEYEGILCTYDGRAFERVENTTRRMPQARYEALLLDRAHSRRRWENQPAEDVDLRNLDKDEILRIVEAARSAGRLVGPVGKSLPDLLDRLGVRRRKRLLRAAMVLFGKTFLPDFPQCELRMARFLGDDKTEFLDQRQIRGPAFRLLEEAELFCQRHFPLPGRVEPSRMERVDRPLIPPEAMREILVNAFVHRDYSIAGGAVSLAIFDSRVEVWSAGRFPPGITPEALTGDHPSIQRNPIIADVFHRAGLIEKWGRGTNRVVDMCRKATIEPPTFAEVAGSALVTFRVFSGKPQSGDGTERRSKSRPKSRPGSGPGSRPESGPESRPGPESGPESGLESGPESAPGSGAGSQSANGLTEVAKKILMALGRQDLGRARLAQAIGHKMISGKLNQRIRELRLAGFIEYVIPEKPQSRLQKYRLTAAGRALLARSSAGPAKGRPKNRTHP